MYKEILKKSAEKKKKKKHLLNTNIGDNLFDDNFPHDEKSDDNYINFDNLILCVDTEPEDCYDKIDDIKLRKSSSDANFVSFRNDFSFKKS